MAQQFADEVVPDAMAGIEYSSGTTVTFAPGENEKTVKFKILDDKKSEGTEGFSLLLVNPDNAELYEVTVTRQKTEMPLLQLNDKMQNILFAISLCCHRALLQ